MKALYYSFVFLVIPIITIYSQSTPYSKKINRIAEKFLLQYPDDSTRAVKIYLWINKKIKYDYKSFLKVKFPKYNSNPKKILKRKKALCSGLSLLYEELCTKSKLQCFKISGYSNTDHYPATNYFYTNHAWNLVLINDKWITCDITADNGYIKPRKKKIEKAIKSLFHLPVIFDSYKFVKTNSLKYWNLSPYETIKYKYPTLFKAQCLDTVISIKEFENEKFRVIDSPQKIKSFSSTNLNDFKACDNNTRLLKEINEVRKSNPNDHFTSLVNYYNYVCTSCGSKNKNIRKFACKGNVFIDSAFTYAPAFRRDNSILKSQNIQFINNENKALLAYLKKVQSDNNKLRTGSYGKYRSNMIRLGILLVNGDGNTRSYKRKVERLKNIRISKKWDNPKYRESQKLVYQKNLKLIDSLQNQVENIENDFLFQKRIYKHTTDSLISLIKTRKSLLNANNNMDAFFYLSRIIIPSVMYEIDTLSKDKTLILDQIKQFESSHFRKFHGTSTVLLRKIFTKYIDNYHIQFGLKNKDSLDLVLNHIYGSIDESMELFEHKVNYYRDMSDFGKVLYKTAKKEQKTIRYAFGTRISIHGARLKKEKRRYNAYNRISNKIVRDLNTWKRIDSSKNRKKV